MKLKKFDILYEEVMDSLTTRRKPIQKISQMTPKAFVQFLKEFLPLVKNGKIDMQNARITEKIDGNAIRLLTQNGEMKFESSYSGIVDYSELPGTGKDAGKFLYDTYNQLFYDIYEQIGADFKVIGELIWISGMEKTNKVTPVCASYLVDKFGTHGGIVVFDIQKIENGTLIPFEPEEEQKVFGMIEDLNNDDFSFFLSDSIDITKNVTFDLNADELLEAISQPEYNKNRFRPKEDAKILKELRDIQQNVCSQISKAIDNTKGAFSEEGDLIEGIVLKVYSSGNQYGMFSDGYKDKKAEYWNKFDEFEKVLDCFFHDVFGCSKKSLRRTLAATLDEKENDYEPMFMQHKDNYLKKLNEMIDDIKNDVSIPDGPKKMQIHMGSKDIDFIDKSWSEFIKGYKKDEAEEI